MLLKGALRTYVAILKVWRDRLFEAGEHVVAKLAAEARGELRVFGRAVQLRHQHVSAPEVPIIVDAQ